MTYRLLPCLVALLTVLASPAALANPLPFDPEDLKAPAADPLEIPAITVLADIAPPDTVRDVAPPTPTTTFDIAPDVPVVNSSNRVLWLAGGGVGAVLLGAWLLVRGRRRDEDAG